MAGGCDVRRGLSGVLAISAIHFGSWGLVSGGTAELLAQSSQLLAAARGQEAIVAHFNKPLRQHVLQEAADKLLGREGAGLELAGVGRPVAERHLSIGQFQNAVVADGYAEDVR